MPRYFVDLVQAGEDIADETGMELPDLAAVRKEVETTIRDIVSESVRAGRGIEDGEIRVRDTMGNMVLALKFRDVIGGKSAQ
jgi:hypothetical protein